MTRDVYTNLGNDVYVDLVEDFVAIYSLDTKDSLRLSAEQVEALLLFLERVNFPTSRKGLDSGPKVPHNDPLPPNPGQPSMSDIETTTTPASPVRFPPYIDFATYHWPVFPPKRYDEELSQCIIALKNYGHHFHLPARYGEILHYDAIPVHRTADQALVLAKTFANSLWRPVALAFRGYGGGFRQWVYPSREPELDT